jgi:DNA segregation ATPase FtsK/SpoIIIE, S-DNA-T family
MAKSEIRMNQNTPPLFDFQVNWQNQSTVQLVGLALAVAGAVLFFSLRSTELPWLVAMTGWTAPLVALGLIVVGGVLVLGDRAGYWSVEALLGAELILLGLQAGAFAWHNPVFQWNMRADGSNGGLVGWVLGGLLVAGFGQGMASIFAGALCGVGLYFIVRYTPLVYPAAYIWHFVSWLLACWLSWTAPRSRQHKRTVMASVSLPRTSNFVAPRAPRTPQRVIEYADEEYEEYEEDEDEYIPPVPVRHRNSQRTSQRSTQPQAASAPVVAAPPVSQPAPKRSGRAPKLAARPTTLPPYELLKADSGQYGSVDVDSVQAAIEETLEDFGVPVRVVHVESGPTVTQFGVEPLYTEQSGKRRKVRVNRIVNLADDLALALAAPSVRIEAPVPGRAYVGIEVPNTVKTIVCMRGILESASLRQNGGKLLLALGRDTAGAPVVMDMARAPHLLIAGATGAGKSVCINTIIMSLLMQHGPEMLKFVMIDPKMVELPGYNGIPHLIGKVITDVNQVMGALTWLLLQMEDRYRAFRELGVRNIDAYNDLARQRKRGADALTPLPYIVLIIDELADLMMTAAEDIERQICRLAQMARATGIHLILATQRPSADVVTGLIKANFPSRIAFAVTSQIDSRVILDTPGAEQLLGRGDMLLMRSDAAKLGRVQGCFVADDEISQVVEFWKQAVPPPAAVVVPPWNGLMDQLEQEDDIIHDAMDVLRGMRTCSTSMLQRKLRIGYPKAARLMEQLESQGIVGPDMGGGQGREVLLKEDESAEEDEEEMEPGY